MKNSNGRVQNWRVAFLLAAFVAACSPDGNGVTDTMSGIRDRSPRNTGSPLTGTGSVNLGASGEFVILAKSGISTVPQSVVTGNIGVSPIARGGITGFSEIMDVSNTFSTSGQVVGRQFAADYALIKHFDISSHQSENIDDAGTGRINAHMF